MSVDLLPNCVARESRDEVVKDGVTWIWVYCANCHKRGPRVVKQHLRPGQLGQPTYAHYLCDGCFEKHGVPVGHQAIPDELFWEEAHNVMMEEHGRILTGPEIEIILSDDKSSLSLLAREKFSNPRFNGGSK